MMRQLPLALPFDASMGAEDYLVTASNRDATAWVDAWPVWPAPGLVISGAAGSGKTHLLSLWRSKSGAMLLTPHDLRGCDAVTLAAACPHLALDDAAAVAGDAEAEEALFHLFNRIKSIGGSLVLVLAQGVAQAGFALPDLRSRLLTLPVAALEAPDDMLVTALIVKQFRDRQIALDAGVVAYLTARTPRDSAGVRDLVERLDRAALAEGRKISVALARRVLEDDHA